MESVHRAEVVELKAEVDAIKARQRHQTETASPGNEAAAKKSEAGAKKTKAKEKPWWHFGL